ncbi:hypothetical protein AU468_11075 [Alkalispirochaeta sphaeroplastigenens]|uniref:NAD-dependent epimerase/dehydratase domain-containing protein n=1 Tax=Alkalispirochaeta sphaeroplastigenens TaxID=1187066 RepID=A0A2S4JHE7_9SPIO|nr:SDR family oxidoreductase [Alkalispirochaeta sphaeroplastigenens]POQ98933.1 hypothetical protein AU468_11075 [Alkalispirochaeta sphaeroplastigenens]
MRTLVTGGLGYVGGRVAALLASSEAFEAHLGSRRERPRLPEGSPLERCSVRTFDVLSPDECREACRGMDAVVHLAAIDEHQSAADPRRALEVNSIGTLNMLLASIEAGAARFLYFSTAHVYCSPLCGVIDERLTPRPVHPYAITHKTSEDFVLAARNRGEIDGVVVRLSNGFGYPETLDTDRWTLLVNDLCRQAVASDRLLLKSSGMQQRDFITLEDAANAVKHLLSLPSGASGDGIFNLGSGRSYSVLDMALLVASRARETLGKRLEVERLAKGEATPSDMLDYRIDRLLATGFAPSASFEKEIDGTLLYCAGETRHA